jgi:hypothetical protein
MSRLLSRAGRHIGSHTYVRLRKLTTGRPVRCPEPPAGTAGARLPPPPRRRQPGGLPVLAGYGRLTGPLALMSWCHATGGLLCVHLPPELAPTARMLSRYVPVPLIPAYVPVPFSSL